VRVIFPLDYEVTPNDEFDERHYIPRMSDYGDKTSSHGVQLYKESELYVFFIDGCVNKPIIYGALAHGGTSDLDMKEHHNRHIVDHGQGSSMGYGSDTKGTNDIFLKSEHKGEVSWINQGNHGMLDQLMATTAHRSEVSTGEYQSFHGFDEDTNFSANHHRSLKPKVKVEDQPKVNTEKRKE
jgi:type VI secretion system secreted protein VgrG